MIGRASHDLSATSPRIDFHVRFYDSLGSTNDELNTLAAAGAAHGTVVRAGAQTAGRGRRGRHWASPPGNLYLSILLRSPHPARRSGELGFVAGLAVADAVDTVLPAGLYATLKWPNDVLVAGAKVAGVLVEAANGEGGAVIVGIGLNVAYAPSDLPYPATSLREHCASDVTADAMLGHVLPAFAARWTGWTLDGFAPSRESWLRRGPPRGARLRVTLPDGAVNGAVNGAIDGTFEDLHPDGALALRTANGLRRIVAGDVAPTAGDDA